MVAKIALKEAGSTLAAHELILGTIRAKTGRNMRRQVFTHLVEIDFLCYSLQFQWGLLNRKHLNPLNYHPIAYTCRAFEVTLSTIMRCVVLLVIQSDDLSSPLHAALKTWVHKDTESKFVLNC